MKKLMKRIGAVLMAVAMMAALGVSAWAEGTSTPSLTNDPKNNLTKDAKITVQGLEQGDTVTYYRVVKWDNGWVLEDQFKGEGKLTDEDLNTIVGNATTAGAISAAEAVKISQVAGIEGIDGGTVGANKKWEAEGVAAGLYMVIVTPGVAGVVYNPIFVAADYYDNSSNDITLVDNGNSYSDTAMAKKSKVTLEKTASTITETPVGSDVDFTVETVIPRYGAEYEAPVFTLTDSMSAGLAVKRNTLTVKYKNGENYVTVPEDAYTLTWTPEEGTTATQYEVAFKSTYIQGLTAATDIKIDYKATITGDVAQNVNPEENTVDLKYSNGPKDTTGAGKLRDKTEHYTFDIDGVLYGENTYKNSELVKVGIDKDGNEITETVELDNGKTIGALQGAEFKLYKSKDGAINETAAELYTNDKITADTVFISGADGRMNIKGLAKGTYWLKETKAPDGYIKQSAPVKIEITTEESEKTITDADGVSYKVTTLDSYKILINGAETASYSITNEGTTTAISAVNKGDTVVGKDGPIGENATGDHPDYGKIQNIQGVELPSTGGIGTYIFTVAGVAIMAIAAGLLIVRHKKKAE
jgi:LPXTG-motif cell wall-anchored protein